MLRTALDWYLPPLGADEEQQSQYFRNFDNSE